SFFFRLPATAAQSPAPRSLPITLSVPAPLHPPPAPTPFPYTTLFRSRGPQPAPCLSGPAPAVLTAARPDSPRPVLPAPRESGRADRKSTRLNSSHVSISYAVFCLKKKKRRPGGP